MHMYAVIFYRVILPFIEFVMLNILPPFLSFFFPSLPLALPTFLPSTLTSFVSLIILSLHKWRPDVTFVVEWA